MKVISTNISKSKTIVYKGKPIQTGIFKVPTESEVVIAQMNIIGDEQADLVFHGGEHKAVYAFSWHHYAYWKNILARKDLPNGIFGENFTISNLCEEHIYIGDQLRIGSAILEVSQPRVPCFKLGIALDSKIIPKLFTQQYCTGVYFRVLKPGVVNAGDTVLVERKATHDISIKKLFQAYFDQSYVGAEEVYRQALALDTLAPEWQKKLQKKLLIHSQ